MKKPATKIIEKQIKNTQTIPEKNTHRKKRRNNTEQSRENNAEIKYETLAINEKKKTLKETEREKKLKIIIIIICKSEQRRTASPQYASYALWRMAWHRSMVCYTDHRTWGMAH